MKKYCNTAFALLCLICFCSCKPSPRMRGAKQQKVAAENKNTLSPQIIEKIQKVYREDTGYTIKVIKVHDSTWVSEKCCYAELIIEREGKRYLTHVRIEEIDGVPVIETLNCLDKEIK